MVRDKKISCVILNYNDAETTKKLVKAIYGYGSLDSVVVVDNGSGDDSLKQLKDMAGKMAKEIAKEIAKETAGEMAGDMAEETGRTKKDRLILLEAKRNGGYGAGNNLGVWYSCQVLGADYVLIANPDVEFSDKLVSRLALLLKSHPKLGAVSAAMEDPVYGRQRNGWPMHGFWGSLARSGPVSRRLFGKALEYGGRYFQGKQAVYVDALHGSLLMVDGAKFKECGGYDEGVFLYNEEEILGARLKGKGYKSALLLTDSYVHRHSQSISKTYQGAWQRQKLRNKSALYYYRKYLKVNWLKELAARGFFQIVRLEIWLCGRVLGMRF